MERNLEKPLQALRDNGIDVTGTMLWDGGIDYGLFPFSAIGTEDGDWDNVARFDELADGLHRAALKHFPTSAYFEKSVETAPADSR